MIPSQLLETMKKRLLKPPPPGEYMILLLALTLNLLDSFTTLSFTVTGSGVELNPVLKHLLTVNPFLVYPFLISMLLPIILFRFNTVVEYGLAFLLISLNLTASLNNLGVILSRYSLVLPFLGAMDVQFFAFLMGLTYVAVYTLYTCIENKYSRLKGIKTVTLNFLTYLLAYFILSLIPALWLIAFP